MCSGLFFTIGKKKVQSSRQLLLERRACFTARWEWRRWRKAGKQNLSIWWASRMFWTQLHISHWNSPTGIISTQNHSAHYHSQDQALQDKGLLTTHKHPPRKEKNQKKKKNPNTWEDSCYVHWIISHVSVEVCFPQEHNVDCPLHILTLNIVENWPGTTSHCFFATEINIPEFLFKKKDSKGVIDY